MMQIAKIRYTINTSDPFYKAEQDYFDEVMPLYQGLVPCTYIGKYRAPFIFSNFNGTAVDEFQHFVYEHPEATPAERKAEWRRIERAYIPSRECDDMPFLERGGFWHQQHIFKSPFYYIDYALMLWHRFAPCNTGNARTKTAPKRGTATWSCTRRAAAAHLPVS
jgi:hypothetical protein